MRAPRRLLLLIILIGVVGTTTVAALAATTTTWGSAIEVPGTAAHNVGTVLSVSCASSGDCAAGGYYEGGSSHVQAFVVNETNGVWHNAIKVAGTSAFNHAFGAQMSSLSCANTGDCAGGGYYVDTSHRRHAFVASEVSGVWGKEIEVPGTAALNLGGDAQVNSVSCASAGYCAAGGFYQNSPGKRQAFAAIEKNGVWHNAIEVPGTAALNRGGDASVTSISCALAGSCTAGGFYRDRAHHRQVFVVNETNGVWRTAIEVRGTQNLNVGGDTLPSVSCGSAGNCAAGGYYTDGSGHEHAFVVRRTNGVWGTAINVPGIGALQLGDASSVLSVSCVGTDYCAAAGDYDDGSGRTEAFLVDETNGVWGTAIEVPGTAALNTGGYASANSISCLSARNCALGGDYTDGSNHDQVFVVGEEYGDWGTAVQVPGTAALNTGNAYMNSVSCTSTGECVFGGDYVGGSGYTQAFVTAP